MYNLRTSSKEGEGGFFVENRQEDPAKGDGGYRREEKFVGFDVDCN